MRKSLLAVVYILLLTFCVSAYAQQDPEELLRAIVKIRALIPEDARTARILGTEREGHGVIIDAEGHVLTIGYLILEAEEIELVGPDNEVIEATFVAYDYNNGFGLVRANTPLNVEAVTLGQSSDVTVGDVLLIAGHGGPEATQGTRVIARQEFAGYWEYLLDDAIFTTPPYADFGGAALFGRDGSLVGIGSLFTPVAIPGRGSVASNMFVPIDYLKPILADLIARGRSSEPSRPWLGINVQEARERVFITQVSSESPGEKASLQRGDIILNVDKSEVKGLADFYRKVWALGEAGVDIPLRVLQGSQIRDIIVHSADRYQILGLQPQD